MGVPEIGVASVAAARLDDRRRHRFTPVGRQGRWNAFLPGPAAKEDPFPGCRCCRWRRLGSPRIWSSAAGASPLRRRRRRASSRAAEP